ncbi:hypothetical protein F4781DRAFT_426939 [Annulohypoxylon bovei var. microspora]|nr:hypothetical protein F4781DRAFT_426939 [Annulohypoxylon bovei var. microspora]
MINRDSRGHQYSIVRGIGRCYFLTRSAPYEKSKFLGSGGSMVARLKLKEIDGRAPPGYAGFLEGLSAQADGNVLGRTRVTMTKPASTSLVEIPGALQLLLFNEESLVSASHQLALITSLPFVHTARRYYRLNGSVRLSDWPRGVGNDTSGPESYPNSVI